MPADPHTVARAMVALLRERAAAMGLTQTELAARTGVSQPRISRLFGHGVALTVEVAVALCGALGIGLDDVYRDACGTGRSGSDDGA